MERPVTVLDVLDNFLAVSPTREFARMSGHQLRDLGREVRRFAATYEPAPAVSNRVPVYLGGWPSANFFFADQGQLVLSALLYTGQVYVKDPLIDWFSDEQYRNEHRGSARPGYRNAEGGLNIAGTRMFLHAVVPGILAMRPLIESGAVVLVPSERFFAQHADEVTDLRTLLLDKLGQDPQQTLRPFHPGDLPVDDSRRGLFTFAGGDKAAQLRTAIDYSLLYFSREWLLAQSVGVEYTATWPYEQHVCEAGLDSLLLDSPHQRVVNALLHSSLPLFRGLTPAVVADVRNEDPFLDFRANLFEVYQQIPTLGPGQQFSRDLGQLEETLLRPALAQAKREAERGLLSRFGGALAEMAMSVGARVLYDAHTGQLGWATAGREVVGVLADRVARRGGTKSSTAWTKLYRHHRSVVDELTMTRPMDGNAPDRAPWHIDDEPSMSVTVSPGTVLMVQQPVPPVDLPHGAYREGEYRQCECGSGLKWKFCCKDLDRSR